jgi:hypothetical protein
MGFIPLDTYSRRSKAVMYPTVVLVAINFIAFIAGSLYLGGDAWNGFARAGHYFVCAHGSCNEVSMRVWEYSYWHSICALAGVLLVFIEAAVFVNTVDIKLSGNRRP